MIALKAKRRAHQGRRKLGGPPADDERESIAPKPPGFPASLSARPEWSNFFESRADFGEELLRK
ncbi:hypothetical protein B0X71_11985 [Planococcus lenghuensis]|uniref:Uncharacterized protein n=1 Tax=Planococcus lenghuensis TaxID=2213202 RepID=A0A1Q2L1H2_9BACL|nr:hypothetical protein B0X71_11985 [Planococcus lenghuensis]